MMSDKAVYRLYLCGEDKAAVPSLLKKSVASKNRKHSKNLKSITSEQDKSVVEIRRFLLSSGAACQCSEMTVKMLNNVLFKPYRRRNFSIGNAVTFYAIRGFESHPFSSI